MPTQHNVKSLFYQEVQQLILNYRGEDQSEQAERLAKLVKTGSVTAIKALAKDLAREGGCPALARRIGTLADEFDTAGLRRLVEALKECE